MAKVQLICRNCGAKLTSMLEAIETVEDAQLLTDLHCNDFESPILQGTALFLEGAVLEDCQHATSWSNPSVAQGAWLHLDDIAEFVADTEHADRLMGCCGLDGQKGPNRVCACGAEVGTEYSDCWTFHMFAVATKNTEWIERND